MNVLVTGGAGFIGRCLVKRLLDEGKSVTVIDDLSNGSYSNIREFKDNGKFIFRELDIRDEKGLEEIFQRDFEIVYHLAAEINVQKSIDMPVQTFERDVIGTFNILEKCRRDFTRFVFMSTCMIYERSFEEKGISEKHPVKPASPYAAAKLSGENLTLAYYYSYELPVVVLRPFNTYGPFQKTTGEGGVVSVFIQNALRGKPLIIYGDGTQTRDLMYVEDCVEFIINAGESENATGQIINAGTGCDVSINDLANAIVSDPDLIKHVQHIHPQSEIMKLKCDYSKAMAYLKWKPRTCLSEGIELTSKWISTKNK